MRLYHATYTNNVSSILKNGLIPNQKHNWIGYDLDDKVFLAFNPEIAEDFLSESNTYHNQQITIIEVNADLLDLDSFTYDWNNFCTNEEDITSVVYEGRIPPIALRLLSESEKVNVPLIGFEDLKRGDDRSNSIFGILKRTFDEEVIPEDDE